MPKPAIRVALVDDDTRTESVGALAIGLSVYIAAYGSARAFLSSLRADLPHCLVVDLHMPEITGIELQRHLIRAGIKIPTIVVTAFNEPSVREHCRSAGAAAFLVKPINSSSLISAINAAVSGGQ